MAPICERRGSWKHGTSMFHRQLEARLLDSGFKCIALRFTPTTVRLTGNASSSPFNRVGMVIAARVPPSFAVLARFTSALAFDG